MKELLKNLDYKRHIIKYKNGDIQTYHIGTGDKIIFSFPSFPHSGLYYSWFLAHYDPCKATFITFDIPGWAGYSDNIFKDKQFSINEYVEIAKKILDESDVTRFSVIGYSFGGALALKLAADMASMVDNIAIVSGVINSKIIFHNKSVRLAILANKLKLYWTIKYIVRKNVNNLIKMLRSTEQMPDILLDQYGDMFNHVDPKAISQAISQLFSSDYSYCLDKLKGKNFLIINSKDEPPMFTSQADFLRSKLNGEKSIYLHGRHDDFILYPKSKVVKAVVDFLTA